MVNHEHDKDSQNTDEPKTTEENSRGQIAFNRQGEEMRHIVASADPQNGGYWNLYVEGRRVGMLARDLKTRTGD